MRLLLVEDYRPARESLEEGLREQGFVVDSAADGRKGMDLALNGHYDVIVLDLMLPKVGGLEILRELRRANNDSHVLILTAKDMVEDRVRGLDLGADDYLVKPFAFAELVARVRALVRRHYGSKAPTMQIADLVIDTSARQVQRAGQRIDLSAREYALLEYLASRAGQVVTRQDIWAHVYDFRSDAGSNVVDVYIAYLRRKLQAAGQSPLIHTRRGQGYVLAQEP